MNATQPKSAFEASLRQAHMLLRAGRAATAERMLRTLQQHNPADLNCRWLLGAALLDQERPADSIALLEPLVAQAPEFAGARVDLARAYRAAGQAREAREQVRRVLQAEPRHHRAWLAYGDALVDLDQYEDARLAFERARLCDPHRQRIEQASSALLASDRRESERLFREVLQADPSHAAALCGLASLSLAADMPGDAERLLRHALRQSAHLPVVWRGLGPALQAMGRLEEAEAAARYLIRLEPDSPESWIALASASIRLLRQEAALQAYERAALLNPAEVRIRLTVGHIQKTLGQREASESSYKAALKMRPNSGEAYWGLADLKNYTFGDEELSTLQRLIGSDAGERKNEAQLHFALGKGLEQRQRYAEAFSHYARGNALRRADAPFAIEHFEQRAARIRAFFDASFFAARASSGDPSHAPIFIVGLPRSGSTLIEQILASHSRVEGTMELQNIINLTRQFDDMERGRDGYPETVGRLPEEELAALGRRYLSETMALRSDREHFTDKLPNNFSHVGLIHAILPNATIIDARRHPMDACFSTFRQHFADGQTFSYDLEDLGRYYRAYLSLMDHWDAVLPGRVLRVQYEKMVHEPEHNIRRLLEHCGLPFEPACLSFHQTRRSVRTPSAEQVRQPIYASGVGYWRHFASELEPLRRALGDALARFD